MILADGKAFLENGTRLELPAQGSPSTPTTEAFASDSGAALVYLVAVDAHSVAASISEDGGMSFAAAGQLDTGLDAIGDIHVASVGGRTAVLVVEATSAAASSGIVATTDGNGGTWSVVPAPVGGDISSAGGRFWINGGVTGDQVFTSKDGVTWKSVAIPASTAYWTASTTTEVDKVGVLIAVTSHDPAGPSDVTFFATSNLGTTWAPLASFNGPLTEFDTTIPTSITPDGHWLAIWPDGSKVLSGSLGTKDNRVISPNGLPANVYAVMFSSASVGVAASSVATCPAGKASCTSTTVVSKTEDGGQDWAPVR